MSCKYENKLRKSFPMKKLSIRNLHVYLKTQFIIFFNFFS